MSMSVSEARTEIKARFTQVAEIEQRYGDGLITNNEDEAQVKKLLGEIDELEDKLGALETAEQRKARVQAGLRTYSQPAERHIQPDPDDDDRAFAGKSIGQLFIENLTYQQLRKQRAFDTDVGAPSFVVPLGEHTSLLARLAGKALITTGSAVGGPLITPDYQPGVVDVLQRERNLLDLIPRTGTTSDIISYVREDSFTNNAAPVAEATAFTGTTGTKPESAFALSTVTAPVETLAHYIPVTNKMLADAPAVRGMIDARLLTGLELKLEDQVLSGNGTSPNLQGILSTGVGIQNAGVTASFNNVADAIFHARTLVRVNGLARPRTVVLNPLDFEGIRLARESAATATLGGYLLGPVNEVGATTLWGMQVVESLGMTENTALVGDFQVGCLLFEREGAQIRVGLVNDQFIRNQQTILAELRASFVVFRPSAFCRVTGV